MAIGLNDITLDEINIMIEVELSRQIKMNNPEKKQTSTAASQLRIFRKVIKKEIH